MSDSIHFESGKTFLSTIVTKLSLSILIASGFAAHGATNVLGNTGFETGDFTSWTGYGNRAVESTNNHYYNGGNTAAGSNVLTHAGTYVGKTYGLFNGGANTDGVFQDSVAGPGSVWSAEGYALSHQQDFIQANNRFWFEVTFRDAGNAILAMYKSYALDPLSPEGVISNVWNHLTVTNVVDISDPSYQTFTNTASSFTAPAGTAKARFQVVFSQIGNAGGSVYYDDLNLTKVAGTDPDISVSPASRVRVTGTSVSFSVIAAGATTLQYHWRKDSNDLSNGPNISGATTATLTLSNLTLLDAGLYDVRVTDNNGSLVSPAATLTVLTPEQAANYLFDPGLESGFFSPNWSSYNGAGIPVAPVSVHSGTNAGLTYSQGAGSYNGFYQDVRTDDIRTVAPGSVFAADGWAYTPSGDPIAADNTAWLEVHFHNGNGDIIGLYKSAVIDVNFTQDTWINLPVTNIIAFWSDYSVAGTTKYLTVPDGTAYVRYQTVFHVGSGAGAGTVLFDDMRLLAKTPVTITVTTSGANLNLSFKTLGATNYEVRYKDNLTDADWQLLTTVPGDGSVKTVSTPIGSGKRFYTVKTL
jgi:hypothetical protein